MLSDLHCASKLITENSLINVILCEHSQNRSCLFTTHRVFTRVFTTIDNLVHLLRMQDEIRIRRFILPFKDGDK